VWSFSSSLLTLHPLLFCLLGLLFLPAAGKAATLEVRALLVPEQEAVLSSQISGIIIKLPFEEGERFKEGDTLVELDCRILRAELSKAEMDLEAASETHGANLRLQEFGSVSELEVAVSSAKKKRAQAEVLLTRTRIEMCIIAAPFNGRVISRQANPFENINPEDKLLEILDDSQLKIHLLIPSYWLRWLETGTAFNLVVDETGKKYEARVTGIGARVNPVNQTLEVRAAINGENPELLAGMSGTAFFNAPPGFSGPGDNR
jgi:RND family efflux transporter MFP subunit